MTIYIAYTFILACRHALQFILVVHFISQVSVAGYQSHDLGIAIVCAQQNQSSTVLRCICVYSTVLSLVRQDEEIQKSPSLW